MKACYLARHGEANMRLWGLCPRACRLPAIGPSMGVD